jgi:threonine aldolase
MTRRSFTSDNNAPACPAVLEAIAKANHGDAPAYGADEWTARATARFREHFGPRTEVYFAFNGTGANVTALGALLQPWQAVLCPASAHVHTDECGALERFAGSKVIPIPTEDGKLRPADLAPYLRDEVEVHFVQPRILSISQATEYGGVYELEELRELCAFAHDRGLLVHVDGARIANAAAALGVTPRELTADAGVDVLTFGGTKNGLLFGEAVLFFEPRAHAGAAAFVQKQAMQLASKMRYIAAQFDALLDGDLWLHNARHANAMTSALLERVSRIDGVRITRPVRCNVIFASMERTAIERAQHDYPFLVWDERLPEVRWMTHWATTTQDVDLFADALQRAIAS